MLRVVSIYAARAKSRESVHETPDPARKAEFPSQQFSFGAECNHAAGIKSILGEGFSRNA